MQTELMKVTGMTCGSCVSNVTQALKTVPGVSDVSVTLAGGATTVRYDESATSSDQLKSAVKTAGYGLDEALGANTLHARKPKSGCC